MPRRALAHLFALALVAGCSGAREGTDDPDAGVTGGDGGASTLDAGAGLPDAGALPDAGTLPTGSIPAELVGIWQETRASAGEYTNGWGQNFDVTSGFSVVLKMNSQGQYYFAHFASGVSPSCAAVSYFDQSVGAATLVGNVLTLQPAQRRLDIQDCQDPRSVDLGSEPIVLTIQLQEAHHYNGGLRTLSMSATGGPVPLDLTLLLMAPLANPAQPPQPADFVLGTDLPYQELQGQFVGAQGTDATFFDPATGAFHFPELNGSPHSWLRFDGARYEVAIALQNVNYFEGVCKLDVIFYETGEALFAILEDVGGQGNHFVGHTRFAADQALMIARIRNCDDDDGDYGIELVPQTSYYRFIYYTAASGGPERIELPCNFPESEYQSFICGDNSFVRRD